MPRSLIALLLIAGVAAPAAAIKPFQTQFMEKYAEGSDEDFNDAVKEAKCYVCHQGRKKKNRNPYGKALEEHLTKKDGKDLEKIKEALAKVADESSDPDDPEAPTFGELITEGKLPGGDLERAKMEPDELEEAE